MLKPELISFDLCPFVQRSVITLLEKQVDFDITYIDLAKPPKWFLDISPFGKVPLLRVGKETLFESAVINEYLDDITPPSMHPVDPLARALNKAWIEFASQLLVAQYEFSIASSEDDFDTTADRQRKLLSQLEAKFGNGPFFNGADVSLIDAAYAPFFTRNEILKETMGIDLLEDTPKVSSWADKLIRLPSVINSVKQDFRKGYVDYLTGVSGYASKQIKEGTN